MKSILSIIFTTLKKLSIYQTPKKLQTCPSLVIANLLTSSQINLLKTNSQIRMFKHSESLFDVQMRSRLPTTTDIQVFERLPTAITIIINFQLTHTTICHKGIFPN